jgi:hypothetical protein
LQNQPQSVEIRAENHISQRGGLNCFENSRGRLWPTKEPRSADCHRDTGVRADNDSGASDDVSGPVPRTEYGVLNPARPFRPT